MFRSQFLISTSYFPNKLFLTKNKNSYYSCRLDTKSSTDVFLSQNWEKTLVLTFFYPITG